MRSILAHVARRFGKSFTVATVRSAKVDNLILTTLRASPEPLDVADIHMRIENRLGRDFRLALTFDRVRAMLNMGVIEIARKEGERRFYRLAPGREG